MSERVLLVMDVQQQIVGRFGDDREYLSRLQQAIAAARAAEIAVIYLGAHCLILAGIATSGVVLSTLRQAADLDFDLTVLSDGCLDADDEVHRLLTEKVFPRQATVLTVADWMSSLK